MGSKNQKSTTFRQAMRPPIFPMNRSGNEAQQFMHRARMFKEAAAGLVAYSSSEQNWPRYALLLHAMELALKAFLKQREMQGVQLTKRPHNHDLKGWYDLAVQHGLKDDPQIAQYISHLTDLHFTSYARYPQERSTPAPDLSIIADETVEYLYDTASQAVYPR
jgi:hypothetical protein